MAQTVKRLSTMWETWVQALGREDPLEKEMATHSSTIAWKIPRTEEPGGLQPMGSHRVGSTERLHFPVDGSHLFSCRLPKLSCDCRCTCCSQFCGGICLATADGAKEKIIDFQFVHVLFIVRIEAKTSKLLMLSFHIYILNFIFIQNRRYLRTQNKLSIVPETLKDKNSFIQ